MLDLTKSTVEMAWPLAVSLLAVLGALVALVFIRRARWQRQRRRLDVARAVCDEVVSRLRHGGLGYEDGLARLRTLPEGELRQSVEELLAASGDTDREWSAMVARLCVDLGLVERWARTLSVHRAEPGAGRARAARFRRLNPFDFVFRAEAAEKLGVVRHRPSWPLLVDALGDSSQGVRSAAANALARIQEPASLPALNSLLSDAVVGARPGSSVRSLKMAIASYPLAQAETMRPLLLHAHARVRAAAADVVGVMVERDPAVSGRARSELAPAVAELFLTRLADDEDADVRARAADVLGRLHGARVLPSLVELAGDPVWFVRLHAVRALGRLPQASLAALRERLTDRAWRVREAAAQALCAHGELGLRELLDHFLTTADRYSREQAAEQIERAGLVARCRETLREPGGRWEAAFLSRMTELGRGPNLHPGAGRPAAAPPEKA